MSEGLSLERTVTELREAFDRAFTLPRPEAGEEGEALLAVRVAGEPYALRVAELSGLVANRKVVALPGSAGPLLGLAGIRGALVPVYSLAALLGLGGGSGRPRWLALCGAEAPVGLAFDELEGSRRVPRSSIYAAGPTETGRRHVREVVRSGPFVRPLVGIASLGRDLPAGAGGTGNSKEG